MHINSKKTLTISSGSTQTPMADLSGYTICGIFIPSAFDGTTLTVQVSNDEDFTTSFNAQAASTAGASTVLTLTVAAGQYAPIENLAISAGWKYVKFTAGTSQTGDSILTLALREV